MMKQISRHVLEEPEDEYDISYSWIQTELERANVSLNQIHNLLSLRNQSYRPEDEEDGYSYRISTEEEEDRRPSNQELNQMYSLANLSCRLDCLEISHRYLEAMKKANGSADIQDLVSLELQLQSILRDYSQYSQSNSSNDATTSASLSALKLVQHIDIKARQILHHIHARCILFLRKMLSKHSFPNPNATEFLVEEIAVTTSGLYIHVHSLKQVDGNNTNIARELLRPIVSRIDHHFLKSLTVPQKKIDKLPHVLLEYMRTLLKHTIPVFRAFQVIDEALALLYSLIQHVLFCRGYYETFGSDLDVVKLCRWVEDILQFSQQIQNISHDDNSLLTCSLFQVLVGHNEQVWEWWLHYELEQAHDILSKASHKNEIVSCKESFESLVYSLDIKVGFIHDTVLKSDFINQVVIPSCMNYMDILAGKAKSLKRIMNNSMTSIDNIASVLHQWMNIIDTTESVIGLLDSSKCTTGIKSLVSSFQKLCDGMVDECARSYLDLLLERSTFSSFLMTASYLLENGVESCPSETFMGILSAWSNVQGIKKYLICHKIGQVVSEHLLTIVLDESLKLSPKGCHEFSRIALDISQELSYGELDAQEGDLKRLKDIATFLRDESSDSKMKYSVYNLLEKDLNEMLSIDDLESDGTIFEEVEMMIRSKFTAMTVHDALNLLNRIR